MTARICPREISAEAAMLRRLSSLSLGLCLLFCFVDLPLITADTLILETDGSFDVDRDAELIEDPTNLAVPKQLHSIWNASVVPGLEAGTAALSWTVTLNNGLKMPRIGFGTYLADGPELTAAVEVSFNEHFNDT